MTALNLTPKDANYLQSRLVFQNLTTNAQALVLDAANVTAGATSTPEIHLDGQGRAHLSGALVVSNATPAAGMALFTLPEGIPILEPFSSYPISIYNGSTYAANYINFFNGTNAIQDIQVNSAGKFTGQPLVTISGPGTGFTGYTYMGAVEVGTAIYQSGSGSYAPLDTFEFTGGTPLAGPGGTATGRVDSTWVVAAAIANPGSGGSTGNQTVTGTTGTGTKFTALVTVAGGVITEIAAFFPGSYSVNPTDLSAEPVTGGGLTGATLSLKMGVKTFTMLTAGIYSVIPTALGDGHYGTTALTGSGTGFEVYSAWGVDSVQVLTGGYGYTASSQPVFSGGGKIDPAYGTVILDSSPIVPTAVIGNTIAQTDIIYLDGITLLTGEY